MKQKSHKIAGAVICLTLLAGCAGSIPRLEGSDTGSPGKYWQHYPGEKRDEKQVARVKLSIETSYWLFPDFAIMAIDGEDLSSRYPRKPPPSKVGTRAVELLPGDHQLDVRFYTCGFSGGPFFGHNEHGIIGPFCRKVWGPRTFVHGFEAGHRYKIIAHREGLGMFAHFVQVRLINVTTGKVREGLDYTSKRKEIRKRMEEKRSN